MKVRVRVRVKVKVKVKIKVKVGAGYTELECWPPVCGRSYDATERPHSQRQRSCHEQGYR